VPGRLLRIIDRPEVPSASRGGHGAWNQAARAASGPLRVAGALAPADPPAGNEAAAEERWPRPGDQRRMRSQINPIRAAADTRPRCGLGGQIW